MPGASISNFSASPGRFFMYSPPAAMGSNVGLAMTESGGSTTTIALDPPAAGTQEGASGVGSPLAFGTCTPGRVSQSNAADMPGTYLKSAARGGAPSDTNTDFPDGLWPVTTRRTFMWSPLEVGCGRPALLHHHDVGEAAGALLDRVESLVDGFKGKA